MKMAIIVILFCSIQIFGQANNISSTDLEIINIGSRLELFTDYYLIDTLIDASLKPHEPIDKGSVLNVYSD